MRFSRNRLSPAALTFALATAACTGPDVGALCALHPFQTPAEQRNTLQHCTSTIERGYVNDRSAQSIDLLFVVSNTPSMVEKQKQLALAIDRMVAELDRNGSDYHIGVTSTDVGAQLKPGLSFQPGGRDAPGCASYAGDDGTLQSELCTLRDQSAWSREAKDACTSVCTKKQGLPPGQRFLQRLDEVSNAPNDDVAGTLRCMLMLGDGGCTISSPLEAAKRALDEHQATNSGFLRQNSQLVIVFVTDEDDCSVQMSARAQNNPNSMDCTGSTMSVLPSDCYNSHFRCLANSIRCNEPLSMPGVKTGCKQSDSGYLEPIDKYVRFFSNLRSSNKLTLVGLWTPSMLDNLAGDPGLPGKLVVDYDGSLCIPGAGVKCPTNALDTGMGMAASCTGVDAGMNGRAQIRLSSFSRFFDAQSRLESSICAPEYDSWLKSWVPWVSARRRSYYLADCLSARPQFDDLGNPRCVVGLVDTQDPDAAPDVAMPQCGARCCQAWAEAGSAAAPLARPRPYDASIIAACGTEPTCYCAVPNPLSYLACKDGYGNDTALAGVWYQNRSHQTPAGKIVNFMCAVEKR